MTQTKTNTASPSQEEARELPVAWRWRYRRDGAHWTVCQTPRVATAATEQFVGIEVEPLFTRPTPDLGDVDELVERLRAFTNDDTFSLPPWVSDAMEEAADTLLALKAKV